MVGERRAVDTPAGRIEYTLRVKAVKNMNLRLRADGLVTVSVPRYVSRAEADRFVEKRAEWIVDRQTAMVDQCTPLCPPNGADALPVLAASLERMLPLVEPLGVKRPVLRGRFMTSRWGSCHWAKGIVVLNTALAAVEKDLLDYVTLHELVHFLHPNHGAGFYAAMDGLMPDWRARRSGLRRYSLHASGK